MSSPRERKRRADGVRNRQLALDAATALLAEPATALTVETIAARAGLGVGTVVRAFGGKDALLDAAAAGLLTPLVHRGRDLLADDRPGPALRSFLAELITFQAAHHPVADQLGGLDVPATSALRAELQQLLAAMLARAQADGTVRTDLDPAAATTVIGQTAYAIARARPASPDLIDTYLTVLMDGLRPPPASPD